MFVLSVIWLLCWIWLMGKLAVASLNRIPSLKMKSRTYQGKYVYKCNNRTWVPVSASAMLVNISDSKISLGNYSLEYAPANPMLVGTWYLRNDDADTAESGTPISIVAGNFIQFGYVVIESNRFWKLLACLCLRLTGWGMIKKVHIDSGRFYFLNLVYHFYFREHLLFKHYVTLRIKPEWKV